MDWSSPWPKYNYTDQDADGFVSNGHPSLGFWNQDLEAVTCGPQKGRCPDGTGRYNGTQMACAMGPWNNMVQWKDNAVRFEGALMAVPFVDYYDHTSDLDFLHRFAYPFVREQARFYASYLRLNQTTARFDVPLACAQEGCGQRQLHGLPNGCARPI